MTRSQVMEIIYCEHDAGEANIQFGIALEGCVATHTTEHIKHFTFYIYVNWHCARDQYR